MKKTRVLCIGICLVLGSFAHAQERRAGGPPYNPADEVTVSGTVVSVETFTPPDGQPRGVLNITVEGKPLAILLGPQEWFAAQRFTFEKGATVAVTGLTGSRLNSMPAMLPRMVKAGTRTLTIRNAKGVPMWEVGEIAAAVVHPVPPPEARPSTPRAPQLR
jgi:hypothetical protein